MKTRILSVMTIVAALVICGSNVVKLRQRTIDLQHEAQVEKEERLRADAELVRINAALSDSERATQLAVAAANSAEQASQLAFKEVAIQSRHAKELAQELSRAQGELAEVRTALARLNASTDKQPTDVPAMLQEALIKMRKENISLRGRVQQLSDELGMQPDRWYLPEDLKGKVTTVDPRWGFLVLDAGEDQGAFAHGELLISRDRKLVAKVRIQETHKDYCIANLMPGWQLAEVKEGDIFMTASE